MSHILIIKNLHVNVDDKPVLNGINLTIKSGEIHAIMGPNGSGKTTLAQVLAGHPHYQVTNGEILFNGELLQKLTPDKRARLGLFLAFQYPREIPGVKLLTFLRSIYNTRQRALNASYKPLPIFKFKQLITEQLQTLKLDEQFLERYLNTGFSGGEKKKTDILQMALLKPQLAVLDETDSGLDIDALKIVCERIQQLKQQTNMSVLMITHYNRILHYLKPDVVHVLINGKIVKSGDYKFAREIEDKGYENIAPQPPKGGVR
ncbi:MAG: Fe-S cluster assembly ATPase SufC [Patescibacteria group bacterium]|jgi:Fe-S cluster assembly ATP-binding protein